MRKNTGENVWWYHSTSFCHKLAQTNKLELLKWAREEKNCDIWGAKTTIAAIKQGNVEMLKYCLENDCPTSSVVCERAAEDGQLECLKYLHEVAGVEWEGQKKKVAHLQQLRLKMAICTYSNISWRKITIFLGQERAMRLPKMVISSASNTYARSQNCLGITKLVNVQQAAAIFTSLNISPSASIHVG